MKYDFVTVHDRRNTGSRKWSLVDENKDLLVPFSVADMEFMTAPEIVEEISDYVQRNLLGYTTYTDKYLDEVVTWQKKMHNIEIDKSEIVATPGVVTAIYYLLISLTEKNDGIIIFRPVYNPFTTSIEAAERKVVNCPLINTNGYYTIDFQKFDELASKLENKALILCNPHNPVGRVWKEEELKKIIEISKKYNLLIISDEIWSDITMNGFSTNSLYKVGMGYEENIIVTTSASKTFNLAGLSSSNILIKNKNLKRKFIKELEKAHLSVNAIGFAATMAAYSYGSNWMEEMLYVIEENYKYAKEFLENNFPGVIVSPLEGTYVMWIDFRSLNLDNEKLEKFMKEKASLYLNEGYLFGEEGNGFERLNIACPKNVLKSALDRLKVAFES